MANLKLDLLNKINNQKYFYELELVRLAQDANMNYEQKINDMSYLLKEIALLNAQLGGVEQYFKEPEATGDAPANAPAPQAQQPVGQVHNGQSHGE